MEKDLSPVSLKLLIDRWRRFASAGGHPSPPSYDGPDVVIHRFIEDSRQVRQGDCFVARVRPYSNGHPYVAQALSKGAALALVEIGEAIPDVQGVIWEVPDTALALTWLAAARHDFPGAHLRSVGVTGTDGKTTITNLLYAILIAAGRKTGMISTINAVIGSREEPTGLHVTTPQAPEIQAYLDRMVADGVTHCVLEVTSMGLAEQRADAALFDVAVVSNITHEHLDYHGSDVEYVEAKACLFEMARSAGVINGDDRSAERLLRARVPRKVVYAIDNQERADVWAVAVHYASDATTIQVGLAPAIAGKYSFPERFDVRSQLVGKFNVYNTLAAIGAALALDIDVTSIQAGVSAVDLISGRMERVHEGQTFLTIVDFAHTPNALRSAIEAAREMCDGRVIAVFGSAGRRDVAKRRLMAEVSAQYADLTVLTAEDPRQEPLDEILEMMAEGCRSKGGVEGETFWRVPDRGRAIYHALTLAGDEDLVIVCGKGHEQSMCFGEIEYDWDDRDATRAALRAYLAGEPVPNLGLPSF